MTRPNQEMELPLGGRTYKIRKFTPETACFWAFRVFGNLTGLMTDKRADDVAREFINYTTKDTPEFKRFMADCLRHVLVPMESGTWPLVNEQGAIILPDINWADVMELIFYSFSFTLQDFFDQARIPRLRDTVASMFLKTGPENSSTSPSNTNTGDNTNSGTVPTP